MTSDNPESSRCLPQPVGAWLSISGGLWALCLLLQGYWRFVRHLGYPYNFPFDPTSHGGDFTCFIPRFPFVHSAKFFLPDMTLGPLFEYPAPAALLYLPYQWGSHSFRLYLVCTFAMLVVFWWLAGRLIVRAGLAARTTAACLAMVVVLSYPYWFVFLQGNIELELFFVVAMGFWAYMQGYTFAAAILFGIAGSMKIYPMIFLALFVPRWRWRELGAGLLAALICNVVSLWVLCPSIAVASAGIKAGLAVNRSSIMPAFSPRFTGWDHSLFGAVKSAAHMSYPSAVPARWVTVYIAVAALIGLALYFARIVRLPLLNQVLCLTTCSILLPPTSFDYTLMHLYVPFILLFVYALQLEREGQSTRGLVPVFVCLAVVLSPWSWVIHAGTLYAAQVKCAALVVLLAIGLAQRWPGVENAWAKTRRASVA